LQIVNRAAAAEDDAGTAEPLSKVRRAGTEAGIAQQPDDAGSALFDMLSVAGVWTHARSLW
jgi:hypothetical protein